MNADLEKAVDMVHVVITSSHLPGWKQNRENWQAIRQHLRDQETEIARLWKRIEEAPACDAEWTVGYGLTFFDAPAELDGKRVALVVVE